MSRESGLQAAESGEAPGHTLDDLLCSSPIVESGHKTADIVVEGILGSILSLMKIRDAVRASILSSMWRNLWTYIPNLKFDAYNMLEQGPLPYFPFRLEPKEKKAILRTRRNKFISSVHGFLRHHQGSGVKLFGVFFGLNKKHTRHLDQWVDFAIRSGAKELVLNLNNSELGVTIKGEQYEFPFHLFDGGRGSSIESLNLSYCNFSLPANFVGFRSLKIESVNISYCTFSLPANFVGFRYLKTLTLSNIYRSHIDIETLLSKCFAIECLKIESCYKLVNLYVSHWSGRLRFLSVKGCMNLMKIELDSIIVTSFEYWGHWVPLNLKNSSRVIKAYIMMGGESYAMKYCLTELAGDFPQLEALYLWYSGPTEVGIIPNSYKFTHLKQLLLFSVTNLNYSVLRLAFFLNLAPFLEKFHVHLRPRFPYIEELEMCPPEHTHSNLKQFEMSGFRGREEEMDLVLYVIRNAVALELVVIDPYTWCYNSTVGWGKLKLTEPNLLDPEEIRREAHSYLSGVAGSLGVKLVIR